MQNSSGQLHKLSDISDIIISNVDKKIKVDEQPVRLCNYMDVYNNQHIRPSINFMNATATSREIAKCSLFKGDVVITKDSEKNDDIGVPAYISTNIENLVCGYHLVILRPNSDKVDGAYLFYALSTNESQHQFHARANGITRFGLRKEDIGSVEVPILPLSGQRAISHILGSLDEKIELNHQMNKTLESTARAIFKSWFVDFSPVRIKSAGGNVNLPDDVASLFPNSFECTSSGEFPQGWNLSTVGSEFNLTMGQSPPGKTYSEEKSGLPFFQGRRDFGFRYPTNRIYCTAPQRLANHDDTLISVRAPVGSINMAMEQCCIGRGIAGIRHKSGSRSYTYYTMHALRNKLAQFDAEGTVFGAINRQQLEGLRWISPGESLIKKFEDAAFSLDEHIKTNVQQNKTLVSLRNTLLPRLVSGDLSVTEAEKLLKEAGL